MPLIEAISRNCKIICSDIPFFVKLLEIFLNISINESPIILTKKIEKALMNYKQNLSSNINFIEKFRWRHIAEKFYLYVKNQN